MHHAPTSFGDGGADNEVRVIDVDLEDCRRSDRRGLEATLEVCVFALVGEVSLAIDVVEAAVDDDNAPPIRGSRIFRPVEMDASGFEAEDWVEGLSLSAVE